MSKDNMMNAILGPAPDESEENGPNELEMISQELIEAVHARNVGEAADALRAAFACIEGEQSDCEPGESED